MTNLPLSQLKILVTRPAHLATKLCSRISELGGSAVLFPTLEIIDALDSVAHNNIKQLSFMDFCIFTSQNAVLKAAPLFAGLSKPTHLSIAAIGQATAKQCQLSQIPVNLVPESDYSTEGLLSLSELQQIQNKKVLIVKGEDGRGELEQVLRSRGAIVTTAIVYRRQCPAATELPIALEQIDIILSTSQESLTNLCYLLKHQQSLLLQKQLLVISSRVASHARQLGFVMSPLVATRADDEGIIEALVRYNKINSPFEKGGLRGI